MVRVTLSSIISLLAIAPEVSFAYAIEPRAEAAPAASWRRLGGIYHGESA